MVDLFCGAGGLSEGFGRAGFQILLALDSDPCCTEDVPAEPSLRARRQGSVPGDPNLGAW